MDPLTQGALGAALPQTNARREAMGRATLCGVLGGMAPDLDVLIRSATDPLLFLEYHRQFTHSLIFIPLGTLVVAGFIWWVAGRARHWSFAEVYRFTFLGYATHALLDACTSYGTLLFWPFSNERVAWNNVSVIDPLLTVPLILTVMIARWRRSRWPAAVGLAWVMSYLALGVILRDDAIAAGLELAQARGHTPSRLEAKPSFGNIVLWKTVYRYGNRYYVDAVGLLGNTRVYQGESIAALDLTRDFPWLDPASLQAHDVERFRWFSQGYLARDPNHPSRITDLRYSLLPHEIRPLWSIELNPDAQFITHVTFHTHRERSGADIVRFKRMLRGAGVVSETSSEPVDPHSRAQATPDRPRTPRR